MAIGTADGWFAAARQKILLQKTSSATAVAANPLSLWGIAGNPGAGTMSAGNTANGVVFTDATAGSPLIRAFGGGATGYLAALRYRNSVIGGGVLYDRLFGVGAITLTAGTTTLTAQPAYTSRLPGGNDYGNLEILLEFTTVNNAAATTVAVTYTNEAGTTGRSTGASGSLLSFAVNRVVAMPLQAGDKGVQKIESVIVTTTGTGAINVIVARRLAAFDIRIINGLDAQGWDLVNAPQVWEDSCLWLVGQPDSTATGVPTLDLDIING
jgi:hypothetical protein